MAKKYLDSNGVSVLWNKIKTNTPTKTSQLTNDSGFLTEHQDLSNYVTKDGYSMRASSTALEFYYNTGSGEKAVQLKAPTVEVPTNISQLNNDSGFVTEEFVNNQVSTIPKMDIVVVSSLPTSDIKTKTIYLVNTSTEQGNLYEEYLYINDKWELLGSAKVDLSGYIPQGGTLSAPLKVTGGDQATAGKIILDQNNLGQITNTGTQTLFGYNSTTSIVVGHGSYKTNIRGSSIESMATMQTRAITPVSNNSYTLGSSSNKWSEIHGTTIYQNGKQVANKEEIPTLKTINGQSIVGSGDISISGGSVSGDYLPLSGGTLTGDLTVTGGASITTKGYVRSTFLYTSCGEKDATTCDKGVCVMHQGWIYYRKLENFKKDLGLDNIVSPTYYMHNIQAVLSTTSGSKYYVAFQVVSTRNTTYGTSSLTSDFSGKSFACSGMFGDNVIYLITISSSPTIYYGSNSSTNLILSSVTDNMIEIK